MKKVTVITGGAGGMGLATAKLLGQDHHVVICDVKEQNLASATEALKQLGIGCDAMVCDITNRASVDALVKLAVDLGKVAAVIHTAGLSPQMADPEAIGFWVNNAGQVTLSLAGAP